jgi:hypothetical protein
MEKKIKSPIHKLIKIELITIIKILLCSTHNMILKMRYRHWLHVFIEFVVQTHTSRKKWIVVVQHTLSLGTTNSVKLLPRSMAGFDLTETLFCTQHNMITHMQRRAYISLHSYSKNVSLPRIKRVALFWTRTKLLIFCADLGCHAGVAYNITGRTRAR